MDKHEIRRKIIEQLNSDEIIETIADSVIKRLMDDELLIKYVCNNIDVEDVYSEDVLTDWALSSGFTMID